MTGRWVGGRWWGFVGLASLNAAMEIVCVAELATHTTPQHATPNPGAWSKGIPDTHADLLLALARRLRKQQSSRTLHTRTIGRAALPVSPPLHTHTYIHTYIHIYKCVCSPALQAICVCTSDANCQSPSLPLPLPAAWLGSREIGPRCADSRLMGLRHLPRFRRLGLQSVDAAAAAT